MCNQVICIHECTFFGIDFSHELVLCVLYVDGFKHCIYLHDHLFKLNLQVAVFSPVEPFDTTLVFFFFTRLNLILYLSCYTAVWCNKKKSHLSAWGGWCKVEFKTNTF